MFNPFKKHIKNQGKDNIISFFGSSKKNFTTENIIKSMAAITGLFLTTSENFGKAELKFPEIITLSGLMKAAVASSLFSLKQITVLWKSVRMSGLTVPKFIYAIITAG